MLISIDGIDGCGKSTQVKRLAELMGAKPIIEISDSRWGRRLRSLESPTLGQQMAYFLADRVGLVPLLAYGGREDKVKQGKQALVAAVIGIFIILMAGYLIRYGLARLGVGRQYLETPKAAEETPADTETDSGDEDEDED